LGDNAKDAIDKVNKMKWTMLTTLVTFGISIGVFGSNFWLTPFSEWCIVLIYLNFFAVIVMPSPYYDTIHPFGNLEAKKQ
jgi:hypothetical protein